MSRDDWDPRAAGDPDRPPKLQLARDWATRIASLTYRPTTRAEIELHLRGHLETLHDALLAEPFSAGPGREIGRQLVKLHLTRPEAIEETLIILADRLLVDLGLDTYTFQSYLNRLLAAVAHGYTRALRDRALADQEQVYCAALAVLQTPEPPPRDPPAERPGPAAGGGTGGAAGTGGAGGAAPRPPPPPGDPHRPTP